ncbi:hypothetical protein B0G69_1327 [Paraburkholderia sp. RAU2J]|uniref:hypothetical protein n=1 Tax=Paraburkholderia sp. RAU2J TaxID=1938810 RepID=UPI000F2357C1|nr:hypothetical protein [Paraburkholderia sp. RAU2J]RKT25609.1 hypothetical protein B0G69_1327 [Paraburkholderia sp. RAU2J]
MKMRVASNLVAMLLLLPTSLAYATPFEEFFEPDRSRYCGVERKEDILETSCLWDATARASGNCDAKEYQVTIGKEPIYRSCRSLFTLGETASTLTPDAPPGITPNAALIWRLMAAIQPIAKEATTVSPPACVADVKEPKDRTSREDHEKYFSCLDEWDNAILYQADTSAPGKMVGIIEEGLKGAKLEDDDSRGALGELTLLLEDEGSAADPSTVQNLVARLK